MSKIRNSFGVLVLPCFPEELSVEQYKERTGINLFDIFDFSSGDYPFPKKVTKLVLLDVSLVKENFDNTTSLYITPVLSSEIREINEDDYDLYSLQLKNNLYSFEVTRKVYTDGVTPPEYLVQTQEI